MAWGGICGSLLGGQALANLKINTIFLLFTVLPTIQLFSCGLVRENSLGSKPFTDSVSSYRLVNQDDDAAADESFLAKKSQKITSRRKKSQKNGAKRRATSPTSYIPVKGNSASLGWLQSLNEASFSLLDAFRQPIILR